LQRMRHPTDGLRRQTDLETVVRALVRAAMANADFATRFSWLLINSFF
jgi:hypothetical protein